MYRYRHGHAKSSCQKRDIQVEVWAYIFWICFRAILDRSDGVAHWCRLGSDAGRSVSPYPGSENGNASDHNASLPPPGPKKKGRPPKNKPKSAVDISALLLIEGLSRYFLAPVQAVGNAAANDDGDALSNRKRVCCLFVSMRPVDS